MLNSKPQRQMGCVTWPCRLVSIKALLSRQADSAKAVRQLGEAGLLNEFTAWRNDFKRPCLKGIAIYALQQYLKGLAVIGPEVMTVARSQAAETPRQRQAAKVTRSSVMRGQRTRVPPVILVEADVKKAICQQ